MEQLFVNSSGPLQAKATSVAPAVRVFKRDGRIEKASDLFAALAGSLLTDLIARLRLHCSAIVSIYCTTYLPTSQSY